VIKAVTSKLAEEANKHTTKHNKKKRSD